MSGSKTPSTRAIPVEMPIARAEVLVLALDLVVARDNCGVAWGRRAVAPALAAVVIVVRLLLRVGRLAARLVVVRRAVVHGLLGLGSTVQALLLGVLAAIGGDEDVSDSATLGVLLNALVFVVWLGEFGNDVPCVDKAGEESEETKENIDDRVCRANAGLHPNRQRREENGQQTQENIGGAHDDLRML